MPPTWCGSSSAKTARIKAACHPARPAPDIAAETNWRARRRGSSAAAALVCRSAAVRPSPPVTIRPRLARNKRCDAAWLSEMISGVRCVPEGENSFVCAADFRHYIENSSSKLTSSQPRLRHDLTAATEAQDHRPGRRHGQPARRWRRGLPHRGRPLDHASRAGGRCHDAPAASELLAAANADDIDGGRCLCRAGASRATTAASARRTCARCIRHGGPTIDLPASFGI